MTFVTRHILTIGCILISCCPVYVAAVTDAELEALEEQIQQQETESKRKAEEESRRKAEAEARRQAEEEKRKADEMRTAELEQQRLEEEKRKAEEARVAKQERLRLEEEARIKTEAEKKEKYTLLMQEAEQAINNRDKKLAISKYREALDLYPNDEISISGIVKAEKLKDKVCYDVLGWWKNDYVYTIEWKLKEDGSTETNLAHLPSWDCFNPEKRQIRLSWGDYTVIRELNDNGNCLCLVDTPIEKKNTCSTIRDACYIRKGHDDKKNQSGEKQNRSIQNPLGP